MRGIVENNVERSATRTKAIQIRAVSCVTADELEAVSAKIGKIGDVKTCYMPIFEISKPHVDTRHRCDGSVDISRQFRSTDGEADFKDIDCRARSQRCEHHVVDQ